jgi:hypothetical protein
VNGAAHVNVISRLKAKKGIFGLTDFEMAFIVWHK